MQLFDGFIRIVSMGRKTRVHYPGAVYHVYARGVDRRPIFIDDEDRRSFLEKLHRVVSDSGARILCYCLMGNHFHLVIQVGVVPLSQIMQRILSGYCMWFNRRHERTGHLFEARHHADICLDDKYLLTLINYIHMNPVRAGLVSSPGGWPWSSYKPGAAIGDGFENFDPWPKPVDNLSLIRSQALDIPSLDSIGSFVAVQAKIEMAVLRSAVKKPALVAARRIFIKEAIRSGHAIKSAAEWLNMSRRSACRYAQERIDQMADLTPKGGRT